MKPSWSARFFLLTTKASSSEARHDKKSHFLVLDTHSNIPDNQKGCKNLNDGAIMSTYAMM